MIFAGPGKMRRADVRSGRYSGRLFSRLKKEGTPKPVHPLLVIIVCLFDRNILIDVFAANQSIVQQVGKAAKNHPVTDLVTGNVGNPTLKSG